jgi:hypothetical protein
MVKSQVSWIEPVLLQPGPLMLEYDEETRRLDLHFDPTSPARTVVLGPRQEAVEVGLIDIGTSGTCTTCRKPIVKAVGLVRASIECEACFWTYHAPYYMDPAFRRRADAAVRGAATRRARDHRDRQTAYAAEMSRSR